MMLPYVVLRYLSFIASTGFTLNILYHYVHFRNAFRVESDTCNICYDDYQKIQMFFSSCAITYLAFMSIWSMSYFTILSHAIFNAIDKTQSTLPVVYRACNTN